MKTMHAVSILPEFNEYKEAPWAVYDNGILVARFVTLLRAKAYRMWLEDK